MVLALVKIFAVFKRRVFLLCGALLAVLALTACGWHRPGMPPRVHNVIVMVPDGSSQSIQTLARWYKGDALNLDGLNSGTARTFMANSRLRCWERSL